MAAGEALLRFGPYQFAPNHPEMSQSIRGSLARSPGTKKASGTAGMRRPGTSPAPGCGKPVSARPAPWRTQSHCVSTSPLRSMKVLGDRIPLVVGKVAVIDHLRAAALGRAARQHVVDVATDAQRCH